VIPLRSRVPRTTRLIIILMIVVIPIVGSMELLETFRGGSLASLQDSRQGAQRAGGFLLHLREILLLLLIGVLFPWLCATGQLLPRLPGLAFFLTCLGVSILVSMASHPMIVPLVGLRQLTYPVLVYALYLIARDSPNVEDGFVRVMAAVAVVEFLAAAVQTLLFESVQSALLGGRVFGTFNNPNTLGAVFAVSIFAVLFLGRLPKWAIGGVIVLCCFGQLMAASRASTMATAFLLLAACWRYARKVESRGMFLMGAVGISILIYIGLAIITGRSETAAPGPDPRLRTFLEQIEGRSVSELLFGRGLGVGTNTLFSMGLDPQQFKDVMMMLDSTITCVVVQIGFVGLASFAFVLAMLSARCGFVGWVLFGLIWVLGLTINWLEFYPINLIVTSAYGMLWAKADQLSATENAVAGIETARVAHASSRQRG
jgi:hypothetical protein